MNDIREDRQDRLYELLPAIYRMRDAEQGEPLRALLRGIAEQVNLLEDDISQLYENWFIETCEDWAVPYIGDLVGYAPVHEAGEPSAINTPQGQQHNKILIPRREVANTIKYRRRKGALALLELLADDIAGWPARAVEFRNLLARTQSVKHLRMESGRTADLRKGAALELLDSPFDEIAHTVDVRRINSHHAQGRHNIPSVGVFVWRLKPYPVTKSPAYCLERPNSNCFTFSILGNDMPLYLRPEPETDPTHIADEFNLPVPIRRSLFAKEKDRIYGEGKNFQIWVGRQQGRGKEATIVPEAVPIDNIISADLSGWHYTPPRGKVAVDPALGRIAFADRNYPKHGVSVSWHYGFSMDMGGGEYERVLEQPEGATIYKVGKDEKLKTVNDALQLWKSGDEHAVIEITDSNVYDEQISIEFQDGQQSLQLRAGNRCRPVIRLTDRQPDRPDAFTVVGAGCSRFILDGVLVFGRGFHIDGDMAELTIRHSTLVPGWTLDSMNERPQRDVEPMSEMFSPSLEIFSPKVAVSIEHSIIGAIQVSPALLETTAEQEDVPNQNAGGDAAEQARCQGIGRDVRLEPLRIRISDSILDATKPEYEVLGAPGCPVAHAVVTVLRSTVIGEIYSHAVDLGENSIFYGKMTVARRQIGCLRFCYVWPESRTPRRYSCQPDLVSVPILEAYQKSNKSTGDQAARDMQIEQEETRIRLKFNSLRYGEPEYCQLADSCADEIKRGADDESEMGVFHDLYQPQRITNLRVRLDEYLPARMNIGITTSN
jgi:hypothetical protein